MSKHDVHKDTVTKGATERDVAADIVAAIGEDRLLDLKFWVEPSASTAEEILETALEWVRDAERPNPPKL